jgi:hypothetical protein
LNPNRPFTASYDQRLYEKTIPPLDVLAGAVWHLVPAGSHRKSDCQPNGNSDNFSGSASINASTRRDREFRFI